MDSFYKRLYGEALGMPVSPVHYPVTERVHGPLTRDEAMARMQASLDRCHGGSQDSGCVVWVSGGDGQSPVPRRWCGR